MSFKLIGIKRSGETLNLGAAPGQVWTRAGLDHTVQELRELSEYIRNNNNANADKLGGMVVVGAGNGRFRGDLIVSDGVAQPEADFIGLLGTIINARVVAQELRLANVPHRLLMAPTIQLQLPGDGLMQPCTPEAIEACLQANELIIVAGGSGRTGQTTDAAILDLLAAYRDTMHGEVIALKATKYDGVYDADPALVADARRFAQISAGEMRDKGWTAVDSICLDLIDSTQIPMRVYQVDAPLAEAMHGKGGTLIVPGKAEHSYA